MIASLVGWSGRNPFLVLFATAFLAVAGVWAVRNTPLDAIPDLSDVQVIVYTEMPGQAAQVVENQVTYPLATALLSVPRARVVRAFSYFGVSFLYVVFEDGTDIYWARSQVAERLSNVAGDLPATVEGGMAPISTPLSDMYMFTLEGPQDLTEKRRVLDWIIRPALRTVPGVADVNALGGFAETFEVRPDNGALAAAGLSVEDLRAAIEASNRNDGAGRLKIGDEALIVRSVGAIRTLDDLASVVVRSQDGGIVRVGDVAAVRAGHLTRYGAVTKDGKGEAVEGLVIALRGADASKVVDGVKARLA